MRVADSGGGIAPEDAERIFTRGWTTKSESGHGIGLALVRRSVQGNGGTIAIETDTVLGGAAITVKFPAQAISQKSAAGAASAADSLTGSAGVRA